MEGFEEDLRGLSLNHAPAGILEKWHAADFQTNRIPSLRYGRDVSRFFAVAAALIAIIIVRAGLLEVLPGIVTFAGALAFGAIGILLALLSLITIWRQGLSGLGYSVTAIAVGGLLLAYPAYLGYKAYKLPAISDITTDVLDPPSFDAIRPLRSRDTNPVQYAGLYAAEQQREAYPEVATLELTVSPKIAYEHALALVQKRRWLVMDAREPIPAVAKDGSRRSRGPRSWVSARM